MDLFHELLLPSAVKSLLDIVNILYVLTFIVYKGTLIGFFTPARTTATTVVYFSMI